MAGDRSSMPMVLEVEDTRQAGALLKELWNWWTREIGKSLITFRPNYDTPASTWDIASRHNHCYCLKIAFDIFLHYKERQDIVCRTCLWRTPLKAVRHTGERQMSCRDR